MRNSRHRKPKPFTLVDPNGILVDPADVERSCTSKTKYLTDWQAKVAADEATERTRRPFSWYRCKYCNNYHIAHG